MASVTILTDTLSAYLLRFLVASKRKDVHTAMTDSNGAKTGILAFIVGSLAGITTGILMAPKSGKETREDIKRKAKEGADTMKQKANQAKDTVNDKATEAVDTAKTVAQESKRAAREARDRVKEQRENG